MPVENASGSYFPSVTVSKNVFINDIFGRVMKRNDSATVLCFGDGSLRCMQKRWIQNCVSLKAKVLN